jgi:2,3-bisphosphoglycerate-dependent phosphoglycerate mutase
MDQSNYTFPDNNSINIDQFDDERISLGIEKLKESGMRIFVVRHGQSTANAFKRLNHPDEELTEKGLSEAQTFGSYLNRKKISFDYVFTSPLKRASDTAKIICQSLGVELEPSPYNLLQERDFGELCNCPYDDIPNKALLINENNLLQVGGANYILDGYGLEPFHALKRRAGILLAYLGENVEKYKGKNNQILLVCHGDISQMIISNWLNLDFKDSILSYKMPNAGGYILEHDNETSISTAEVLQANEF